MTPDQEFVVHLLDELISWPTFGIVSVLVLRHSIADLIHRVTKVDLETGTTKVGVTATVYTPKVVDSDEGDWMTLDPQPQIGVHPRHLELELLPPADEDIWWILPDDPTGC